VYLDGIWLKRTWGGEVKNVSVLVAIGVNKDGFREIIGVSEGFKEDKESWKRFLQYLKGRGLEKINLIISDKSQGLIEAIPDFYPVAKWQRCMVHFYRNVFSYVPHGKIKEVATMLKAIHAQENIKEARRKKDMVVQKLSDMKLGKASEIVRQGCDETFSYYSFPVEHWKRIRTNNGLERIMKEIRRRTRVVGAFPDGESALMLVAARLRHVASSTWSSRKYLNMSLLNGIDLDSVA
jgi:transposase-like protein